MGAGVEEARLRAAQRKGDLFKTFTLTSSAAARLAAANADATSFRLPAACRACHHTDSPNDTHETVALRRFALAESCIPRVALLLAAARLPVVGLGVAC
eukprot:14366660-Alexandrium_andersonii.AAC.1